MSNKENNQISQLQILNENISSQTSSLAAQKRRGNLPCEKQPSCPFHGTWRKDTKSAGGNKGWCM